jgi:hypothetical protein
MCSGTLLKHVSGYVPYRGERVAITTSLWEFIPEQNHKPKKTQANIKRKQTKNKGEGPREEETCVLANTSVCFEVATLFGKIYCSPIKPKKLYSEGSPGSACPECSHILAKTNKPQTLPVCVSIERLQVLARAINVRAILGFVLLQVWARAKQKQRNKQLEPINGRITKHYTCKEKGLREKTTAGWGHHQVGHESGRSKRCRFP